MRTEQDTIILCDIHAAINHIHKLKWRRRRRRRRVIYHRLVSRWTSMNRCIISIANIIVVGKWIELMTAWRCENFEYQTSNVNIVKTKQLSKEYQILKLFEMFNIFMLNMPFNVIYFMIKNNNIIQYFCSYWILYLNALSIREKNSQNVQSNRTNTQVCFWIVRIFKIS